MRRSAAAWLAQVPNTQLVAAMARYIDHVQIIRLVTLSQPAVRSDVLDAVARDPRRISGRHADRVNAAVQAACGCRGVGLQDLSRVLSEKAAMEPFARRIDSRGRALIN